MIKIGDKMPSFEVVDQDGKTVKSEDLLGKKTVIYFYPKDNTSGCTAEACNLRDNYEAMVAKGYNVIGVSKDSAASHKKFIEKYQLPFTLLADTSTEMIQAFGAWGGEISLRPQIYGNSPRDIHLRREWHPGRNHRQGGHKEPRCADLEIISVLNGSIPASLPFSH
jgi:peroxiredoxin Q/BCP